MNFNNNMIEAHVFRETKNGVEFLLLKRSEKVIFPGLWQMVNGKIEESEKAFETAVREIKEETGFIPLKLWTVPNMNSFYTHESDSITVLPVFAALVKNNIEVNLSKEHTDFKWLNSSSVKEFLAWDGQRKSVDTIMTYFTQKREFFNLLEIKF